LLSHGNILSSAHVAVASSIHYPVFSVQYSGVAPPPIAIIAADIQKFLSSKLRAL